MTGPPRPFGPPPSHEFLLDERAVSPVARLSALLRMNYVPHFNHMIAISRTITACILLLFTLTDVPLSALPSDFDGLFALAFAGFAIVTLILSFKSWFFDFTLSQVFIVVDAAAFLLLLAPQIDTVPDSSVPALCLMAHIQFSSVMRWRLGIGILVGALLVALWIAHIVVFKLPLASTAPGQALRWSLFAMIESLIVLWASAQMHRMSLPRFAGYDPAPELPLTASAVGYAMRTAGAGDAFLCWIDRKDFGCYMCSAGSLDDELPPTKLSFVAAGGFKKLAPMVFDIPRVRAVISGNGQSSARAVSAVPGYALLRELGVETGVCIPADNDQEQSWLILTRIPMLGWGHLRLARAIRAEVAQGLSWQLASANALDAALSRLRRTVASDLHDSVAHSLAGAKFLLVALRSKVSANYEVVKEIDSIKDALDAEHLQVRKLIEQLRQTGSDSRARNLIEDLEGIRPTLAARWQIELEFVDSDFRIPVPVWLSLEVQQIVREAVSNAVRHGKASKIAIKCQRRSGSIKIQVTDNGAGFADPHKPALPRSINDRLSQLDGSLEVASRPGSTTLRLSVPAGAVD